MSFDVDNRRVDPLKPITPTPAKHAKGGRPVQRPAASNEPHDVVSLRGEAQPPSQKPRHEAPARQTSPETQNPPPREARQPSPERKMRNLSRTAAFEELARIEQQLKTVKGKPFQEAVSRL